MPLRSDIRSSTRRRRPARVALVLLAAALPAASVLAGAASGARSRPSRVAVTAASATHSRPAQVAAVPRGFVGVDTDGPLLGADTPIDFGRQLTSMVATGVQSIRVAFSWAQAQPYASWADVPADQKVQFTTVDGRPYDFQTTDMIVGAAARDHVAILPTVLYAAPWDARRNPDGVDTPKKVGPYAAYLTALISRYGPHGSFWAANPSVPRTPIREWQIWNEPNQSYYWKQPFARTYVELLEAAHQAIRRADPGAKVVLGALTNIAWQALGSVYLQRGARNLFDIVSVNGFTRQPANVILYLQFMRSAMARSGDGSKPLIATEVSWPSAQGKVKHGFNFDTTEAGQARDLAQVLPLLGEDRVSLHLAGFYYYTWMGDEHRGAGPFGYAGLLSFRNGKVAAKPALAAFRKGALALEQCRSKGRYATSCIK
jgi:hypothetical protein